MKASEFLMAKALEHDDFRLTKIASELHETENDFEYVMTKEAGPIFSTLLSAGSQLLKNKVVRNAAIGAGVGAVAGAAKAQPGDRLNGALKGAALGGAINGIATGATNVYAAMKANPGMRLGDAIGREVNAVGDVFKGQQIKPPMPNPVTPKPSNGVSGVGGAMNYKPTTPGGTMGGTSFVQSGGYASTLRPPITRGTLSNGRNTAGLMTLNG
jgi:hypothetical protein